ncbi:MAG: Crp/Fnr family transcriptional regulator [Candidatus Schekmanbacteria bacterium]|nr:Crp/Fnr family transcriptional regulator [Candidatus Schekmanbacteria bacterium]
MVREIELLKNVPIFSGISDKEIGLVTSILRKRSFPKSSVVIHKGDEGEALYIILSGKVKVTLISDAGKEIILAILREGNFFGEMSLLNNEPTSANVVTAEDSVFLTIYRDDFNYILRKDPGIALNLLKHMSLRLKIADKKIGSLALLDVCGRIANLFIDMAKEEKHEIYIVEKITHAEIAHMIGSTREVVSRAIKCLKDSGYIKVLRDKIILDKDLKLKIDDF